MNHSPRRAFLNQVILSIKEWMGESYSNYKLVICQKHAHSAPVLTGPLLSADTSDYVLRLATTLPENSLYPQPNYDQVCLWVRSDNQSVSVIVQYARTGIAKRYDIYDPNLFERLTHFIDFCIVEETRYRIEGRVYFKSSEYVPAP